MDEKIVDIFRMGRRLDNESRPRLVLIKFESQTSKNPILENSSKLKDSEAFKSVILIQDLRKELREVNEKFTSKAKGYQCKGWTLQIEGQPGTFHAIIHRRRDP